MQAEISLNDNSGLTADKEELCKQLHMQMIGSDVI